MFSLNSLVLDFTINSVKTLTSVFNYYFMIWCFISIYAKIEDDLSFYLCTIFLCFCVFATLKFGPLNLHLRVEHISISRFRGNYHFCFFKIEISNFQTSITLHYQVQNRSSLCSFERTFKHHKLLLPKESVTNERILL